MGFTFCPNLFLEVLSTHLHCVMFEDFYDKTLLCCAIMCSLMSSCASNLLLIFGVTICCALLCGLCYYVFADDSKEEDYCTKGKKWIIPGSGLPNILRDTLNFIRRLLSSKRDLWI